MSTLFFNPNVLRSNRDYVLAGFHFDEGPITIDDIVCRIPENITNLIEDYIDRAAAACAKAGIPFTRNEGLAEAYRLIVSMLDVTPEGASIEEMVDGIMHSPQMRKFVDITLPANIRRGGSGQNIMTGTLEMPADTNGPITYKEAEEAVEENSFENFIEQLVQIEV